MKLEMKESEEVGPTLADIDNLNKQEKLWRQELASCVDDSSLSESQLEDFLRIDIDNIPSEDAAYFVEDINKYFHGNFANIESIEYLENKKWCPVLGLKEVEDEFQFRFEGVTKYSFRNGNVRYIGWGGQDSVDVTDYLLSHRENTDLVGYVLKDDDDNIITPTVNEDIAMLDAVQFLNKEDAIAYAESHPEVCVVAEVYGPDLSLTSDIAWSRIWHQPPLAGLIESKKNIKENKMKKLKEGVILHFDLEDGTHKALPFDSEEDALEYMDSDDFPIGEWVGSYKIETVKEPKKEKPKATEEDYEFQVLEPEDIEKLDELVKEIKDHNEDGWVEWTEFVVDVARKYLGESLSRYGEGEYTPFEDLINECEPFVYYRTTVVDKLLNKRLALQKELEQMKESKSLDKNKGSVLYEALTQKQKNYVLNYVKEYSFFPCDSGKNFYFLVPVDDKHIKMTPKFKKQLKDEGLYGNTFIGGMTDKAELPIDMMWLPIYGDPNRYVTKWLSHSFNSCFDSDLRDRGRGLSRRLDIDKISGDKKFTESVVKWTNDAGEATAYELNEQVKKTLREYGYTFGGNETERPECVPKHFYNRDTAFEGQTVYLCSVKGEFYDEVIIQICDSKVCGMANYTIRSPEGVLWMGQTPREFEEDIHDMTSGYNEF